MHCSIEMPSTTVFGVVENPVALAAGQAACLHAACLQNSFWRSRKQTKVTCWVYILYSIYVWGQPKADPILNKYGPAYG